MFFFWQRSQTSGVVLEDFDRVFANKFYHSHLDDLCECIYIMLLMFLTWYILIIKQLSQP